MSDTSDTSADTVDRVDTYCDDEESMLQSQQEQEFQLEEQQLRRTRASLFLQRYLPISSYFSTMGVELLAENIPRETWALLRTNDLHHDMVNFWPQYSLELHNRLYVKNFRVDLRTYKHLLHSVEGDIEKEQMQMRVSLVPSKRLAITMHFLAKGNTYDDTAALFGTAASTVHGIRKTL